MKLLFLFTWLMMMAAEAADMKLSPSTDVENSCITSEPAFNSKKVHLVVYLLRFCELTAEQQNTYRNKASKDALKNIARQFGENLQEKFNYDMKVSFKFHGSCAAPFEKALVFDYQNTKSVGEATLLVNIVFKRVQQSAVRYAQWIRNSKSEIRKAVHDTKPSGMMTFVIHRTENHHLASTQQLYRSTNDALPNKHYHMEVVVDSTGDFAALEDVKYLKIMKDVFACNPAFLGAIPYQYTDSKNVYQCVCQCPVGEHFEKDINSVIQRCVPDEPAPKDDCGDLSKCYAFVASELPIESQSSCTLKPFEKARLPCPWDNYVAWHQNPPTSGSTPRITVRIVPEIGVEQRATFSWEELKQRKTSFAQLLDKKFTLHAAGIYDVILTARDFERKKSCRTQISVSDDVEPSTDGTCPASKSDPEMRYRSETQVNELTTYADEFATFWQKVNYGPCEHGDPKTWKRYMIKCLNGKTCFRGGAPQKHLKKRSQDVAHLKKIKSTILLNPPGTRAQKCLSVRSTLQEESTKHKCDGSPESQVLKGDMCTSKRCYYFYGIDFYQSKIYINQETKTITKKLMREIDPGFTKFHSQIHEKIDEHEVKDVTRDLSKYFNMDLLLTEFGKKHFDANAHLNYLRQIIRCRYKVPESTVGTAWQEWLWNDENTVELNEESNEVTIECWTSIGRLGRKNFKLVIHPTVKLDICPDLSDTAFYQAVTAQSPENPPYTFCNVPKSDFSDLTLHISNWVGRDRNSAQEQLYYFWDVQCKAYYDHGDPDSPDFSGEAAQVIPLQGPQKILAKGAPETTYHVIKRYGVNLRTSPTTFKNTRVKFECQLRYKDRTKPTEFVIADCPHTITFRDCDAPNFPVLEDNPTDAEGLKDCEDMENCINSCSHNTKPYQYCGSNLLTFDNGGEEAIGAEKTLIKNVEAVPCCSSPDCTKYYGKQFTCNQLGADDALKRCEPDDKPLASLLQMEHTSAQIIIPGIFISAFVVMAIVVRRFQTTNVKRQVVDGYEPLL